MATCSNKKYKKIAKEELLEKISKDEYKNCWVKIKTNRRGDIKKIVIQEKEEV